MSKLTKRFSIIGLVLVIIFFGGRYFVYWKIKDTIAKKAEELKVKGVVVKYSSIDVNSWKGSLSIKDISIEKSPSDSVCVSGGTMKELSVEGISLVSLLLHKKLKLESVVLTEPWLQYSQRKRKAKSADQTEGGGMSLKGLQVGLVRIDSGKIELVDSASCRVTMKARFNFQLENILLDGLDSTLSKIKMESVTVGGIVMDLPEKFYHLTIRELAYSHQRKSITLDSLHLVPTLARSEFAKRSGKQVDQFNLVLPKLTIEGYEMSETTTPSFIAREADLQFDMDVYRDKRYPRAIKKPKVLPMAFLHKFDFPIRIDSVNISPSTIVYHERPEKGDQVGRISFNELRAGIYNITNDSVGESTMNVKTRFMNAGNMDVEFSFPHERGKLYGVRGSLTKFSMPEINKMLEPAAHIRIESGNMQAMKFNFQYDSKKSNGELELRYTDLKVVAIKDDEYKTTNKIVTLIIGALVKKKIDINDPKDKRTGTIAFERDPQKAILNYWWKSVLSGVKSVFGFDTALQKETEKKKTS